MLPKELMLTISFLVFIFFISEDFLMEILKLLGFILVVEHRKGYGNHNLNHQSRIGWDSKNLKDRMIPPVVLKMFHLITQLVFRIAHLMYCGFRLCS